MSSSPRIDTLGQLKAAVARGEVRRRPVRDEVRDNLSERLRRKDTLFPGIIGYDDTVVPQLVNAMLARHHFILLGLRGQAKTRILRALTTLLDEWLPVIPESEINDDPIAPLSAFGQNRVKAEGDQMPIRWLPREARYVEKLATPDVTIADMIGDIDPIKAAKGGLQLGSELSMHFGLLPRANRGIFAINELPDLAGKIQVGLFNILQEGDVQIKGYPVRLPLDVLIAFTANPEDYTARGKIITPLKDRIGAEIRTHYMQSRADAMSITEQEAWVSRGGAIEVPRFVREVVEEIAFQARTERKIDKRSGVSQRLPISVLETVVSNAERRALANGESPVVARVTDIYAALAVDDRQVRARVRRRAEGRRPDRARAGAERRGERLRRLLRQRRPQADHRLVRHGRLAEPVGRHRRRHAGEGSGASAGPGRSRASRRHRSRRGGAAAGRRHRLRARGPLLAEEDQPQRRARLPRRRGDPTPAAAADAPPILTPDDEDEENEAGTGGRRSITTDASRS